MEYIKATEEYALPVFRLVQDTITNIYPKYYPKEIVDFFCELHNIESIIEDIRKGCVWVLLKDDCLLGTGSYRDNHITRVYVGLNSFVQQA